MSDLNEPQLMLDLETMGLGNSAAIIQLGFVVFRMDGPDEVSILDKDQYTVSLASSIKAGGEVDAGTVMWWMGQGDVARTSVCNGSISISDAIAGLGRAYKIHNCRGIFSQGANFDIPVVAGYCRRLGWPEPWKYHQARDTRTVYAMAEALAGWVRPEVVTAHTAVADCLDQVKAVRSAYGAIRRACSAMIE